MGLGPGYRMSELSKAYEEHVAKGGGLSPLPDGPSIEVFGARRMAEALEVEVNRAGAIGHSMIRVSMTLDDASRLAAFMRRAAVAGA